MISFILNDQDVSTDQPPGSTVLDFVRYHKNLKGTKIGCREGDCGACTILVGEIVADKVKYRTMTSCLMPLANAAGKHIVSIEGINPANGSLTPVQQALVDESGTQCGFCTVGFVMSLTGFCLDAISGPYVGSPHRVSSPHVSKGNVPDHDSIAAAISAIDGNICRCTGYKSIERAACIVSGLLSEPGAVATGSTRSTANAIVPAYFDQMPTRLKLLIDNNVAESTTSGRPLTQVVPTRFVSGGTDLYVQRHDEMTETEGSHLFYNDDLRSIRDTGEYIELGASVTVTDLLESPAMNAIFPNLYKHLKLVSSTPIRNMATIAGNLINASPIGDMTVWFLALDAEIKLTGAERVRIGNDSDRGLPTQRILMLKDLYLDYKQLAKTEDEYITTIRFPKPTGDFRFNFEKVCKRTYLDIATVNTAISLSCSPPYKVVEAAAPADRVVLSYVHIAAGGVAPIPLYLKETSAFLSGKELSEEVITAAKEIMQSEISPISDVRGTEQYKRLLLRQLFRAHFFEIFGRNV